MTKLNCSSAVSPHTSTLHSSTISVYISVFSLPPSTCLRSSLSLFVVVLLLPSSFFFSIHSSEPNPSSPYSSILYTCQSKALPITSLLNRWLYCWALRHIVHANSVLHWNSRYFLHGNCKNVQLASYWTDECFNSESEQGTLFSFLVCVCMCVCVWQSVCVRLEFTSSPRWGVTASQVSEWACTVAEL